MQKVIKRVLDILLCLVLLLLLTFTCICFYVSVKYCNEYVKYFIGIFVLLIVFYVISNRLTQKSINNCKWKSIEELNKSYPSERYIDRRSFILICLGFILFFTLSVHYTYLYERPAVDNVTNATKYYCENSNTEYTAATEIVQALPSKVLVYYTLVSTTSKLLAQAESDVAANNVVAYDKDYTLLQESSTALNDFNSRLPIYIVVCTILWLLSATCASYLSSTLRYQRYKQAIHARGL